MTNDIYFSCPHCEQKLQIDISKAGTPVKCPKCLQRFFVPEPVTIRTKFQSDEPKTIGLCPYCRCNILDSELYQVCNSCKTPHHQDCWEENKGCTIYGCNQAPPEEEKISIHLPYSSLEDQPYEGSRYPDHEINQSNEPLFLYIPVSRLILMSIFTLGFYEKYWMFKNWQYLQRRYSLSIQPFWRAFFSGLFIYQLFKSIKEDHNLNKTLPGKITSGTLAVGWIAQSIIGYSFSQSGDISLLILSILFLLSTSLYFVPVQNYVNRVNVVLSPQSSYYPWSTGHFVCLALGIISLLISL